MPAPERLSIVIFAGDEARVHYALVMASAAAAAGRRVALFFSGDAVLSLLPERRSPPADAERLSAGIAGFEELLAASTALGVGFWVCEMSLRAHRLNAAALRDDVPARVAGFVGLLAETGDGQMLFV